MRLLVIATFVLAAVGENAHVPPPQDCQKPGCWLIAPELNETATRSTTRSTMRYATGEVFARGAFVRKTSRPYRTPEGTGEVLYPNGQIAATLRTSKNPYHGCRGTGTYYFADGSVFATATVDESRVCTAQLGNHVQRALRNKEEIPFSCPKGSAVAVDGPYWGGMASRKTWGELIAPLTVLCNPPMDGDPEVSWHPNGQVAQVIAPGHHRAWFSNGQLAYEATRFDDRGFATEGRCWGWNGEPAAGPCGRNLVPISWNVFQLSAKPDD
jgi:hypothetical protein